jgi:hypothetical protein
MRLNIPNVQIVTCCRLSNIKMLQSRGVSRVVYATADGAEAPKLPRIVAWDFKP